MKIVIIVQARMGSTRLPGKVMRTLAGRPMLDHVLDRLERVAGADEVVVATTEQEHDQAIVDLVGARPSIGLFCGSEHDVLARYHAAAQQYGADVVVRITADCPLIAPSVVDRCIEVFRSRAGSIDYVTTGMRRTYPRGLDTEVLNFQALDAAHREATEDWDREHVTAFVYKRPERFRLLSVEDDADHSHLRWTVDTPEDFEFVSRIYDALYSSNPRFDYHDVLALLARHPSWSDINRHVRQKSELDA